MKKTYTKWLVLAAGTSFALGGQMTALAGSMSGGSMQDLETLVKNQQSQLDTQASEIAALKEKLNALLGQTEQNKEALADKVDKKEIESLQTDKMVVSKTSDVDVTLYGQINRAGLWADNGDASKFYFVDNQSSNTRMGIDATAKINDDFSIGGKIEYQIVSNASNKVNQFDEDTSADFSVRHTDVWFDSTTYGKLYIGRGDTASNGTSEVDLSGTTVVTYSSIGDMAGGQLWYDNNTNEVTELNIGSVFSNMDGLNRRDRFRYDTPSWAGLTFSAGAVETGAYDFAARYSRKYDSIKVAAAFGYATPGDLADFDNQYNGSFSILFDNGFNLTVAGGNQDLKEDNRNDPTFWYAKLGYKAALISPGTTALSIDYAMNYDLLMDNDEAQTMSLAFVQSVKDWGTDFYIAYRLHSLDRDNTDFDNINTVMGGARVKF